MLAVLAAMAFIPEQRTPLLFGLISAGVMLIVYAARRTLRPRTHSYPT
jgi:GABA permease